MTVTRTDGNVIHADFGKPKPARLPLLTARCEVLYRDEEVVLTRTLIESRGQAWVTHAIYPAP